MAQEREGGDPGREEQQDLDERSPDEHGEGHGAHADEYRQSGSRPGGLFIRVWVSFSVTPGCEATWFLET